MYKIFIYKYISLIIILLNFTCKKFDLIESSLLEEAIVNGNLAQESFTRSLNFTNAWLGLRDSESELIPSNINNKINLWEPANSGADNYPFMVLTAYLLDKDLYHGVLLEMLINEKKLTSRIGSLPDVYSFTKNTFENENLDLGNIIFGSSEYIKDGLMPLNEFIGASPWQDRMIEILDDLYIHINDFDSLDKYFIKSSQVEEINGEMLQTLSRVYWMTGDQKYLDWAIKIADYYLLEVDFSNVEYLKLRDHGCEIVGGLSELYMTLHLLSLEKKYEYQPALYRLLDKILTFGRNQDGFFYNSINLKANQVIDNRIADTWGYTLNAFYTVWMTDQKSEYLEAVLKPFQSLNNSYRNFEWEPKKQLGPLGSQDGYADAIESGINIYNRMQDSKLKTWIDSEIQVLFGMQKNSGIIEGWHGDGNFARTALMYGLWKTQGAHLEPWQPSVKIGAISNEDKTYFVITAQDDWEGQLLFDQKRHKTILNLPEDYPRINQFPEWFTLDQDATYSIQSNKEQLIGKYEGKNLKKGVALSLSSKEQCVILVKKTPNLK
mgnify:FL=1